jgi:exosortase
MSGMNVSAARPALASSTSDRTSNSAIAAALLFLGLLWFEAIRQLRPEWSFNPQYSYGWSVPFLALYLFWRRWPTRPSPEPPDSRVPAIASIFILALLIFPIRFVAEANPDWRLLSWALACVAVTVSVLWVFLFGGWRWLRHFFVPILFFLIAVPWPMHLEQVVTQSLMRAVTSINVWLLQIVGIPALQHGNVIEVGSGLIGIEEACSGVRSLQATLMITLFLGELYRFTIERRIFLITAGAILAFLCNVVRTALLVWIGARNGARSIEAWHDPAGLTILVVCLFGLWLVSLIMGRRPDGGVNDQVKIEARWPAFSWQLGSLLVLVLVLNEAGVQTWYRLNDHASTGSRWDVTWPRSEREYRPIAIAPESAALLQYNQGGGASWQGEDDHRWVMYFFQWLPGHTAAHFVKIHRPDICLPASGLTMETDNGIQLLSLNGVNLPVRSYRFDDHGVPLHVFYCYWDARSNYESVAAAEEEDWTARGRLRAALRGQRELGAQMLELVVWGYDDDAAANEALKQQVVRLVRQA